MEDLLFYHLYKMKHFIGSLVGVVLVGIEHFVLGLKIFAPKLIDLKTALVYIKVDIALFKNAFI